MKFKENDIVVFKKAILTGREPGWIFDERTIDIIPLEVGVYIEDCGDGTHQIETMSYFGSWLGEQRNESVRGWYFETNQFSKIGVLNE